jgi:hypothetical protein
MKPNQRIGTSISRLSSPLAAAGQPHLGRSHLAGKLPLRLATSGLPPHFQPQFFDPLRLIVRGKSSKSISQLVPRESPVDPEALSLHQAVLSGLVLQPRLPSPAAERRSSAVSLSVRRFVLRQDERHRAIDQSTERLWNTTDADDLSFPFLKPAKEDIAPEVRDLHR